MKKVDIKEVARKSGVSIATVSRVFKNPEKVAEETREKVMYFANKLNYTPNLAAQALRGSLNNIGVVLTKSADEAFHNPFYSEVLRGLSAAIDGKNYHIQLIAYNSIDEELKEIKKLVGSGRVNGLVVLASREKEKLIKELTRDKVKFVVNGRVSKKYEDEVYTVDTDNINDSEEAVEKLISNNRKNILFINGSMKYFVNIDRFTGYKNALEKNNIKLRKNLIIETTENIKDIEKSILKFFDKKISVDGIFAKDDIRAAIALKILIEKGIKVPDEIEIIGHNDLFISQILTPKLSTVRVPIYDMGVILGNQILNLLENNPLKKHIILPTKLILRETTN